MRPILFREWIKGEYLEVYDNLDPFVKEIMTNEESFKEGTNCWSGYEKSGIFHEFGKDEHDQAYAIIEVDGIISHVNTASIKFTDNPMSSKRLELAGMAMQGLISTGQYTIADIHNPVIGKLSFEIADELLKQESL